MVQYIPPTDIALTDETRLSPPIGKLRPMLTERSIETITYDLKMAEKLVTDALEEGIDYGQIPGVPGKGLWDPGASKIMNAFETYPRHKILYHEETHDRITWAIECEIIHRGTGVIVGAGVGSCSTREPKYKYRWFTKDEAKELGCFTEPQIEAAKSRKGKRRNYGGDFYEVTEYRLENPEYGEQVDTILKMAAKRSETDASRTLPGVAAALRKLFDADRKDKGPRSAHKTNKGKVDNIEEESPRWTTFWNNQKNLLGDDYREKTHQICGVKSMSDWIKKGESLDDATRITAEHINKHKEAQPTRRDPHSVEPADLKDTKALVTIMEECFGWNEDRIWAEANYYDRRNFEEARVETPWAVFSRLWTFIEANLVNTPQDR